MPKDTHRSGGGGHNKSNHQSRPVQISKALSRLLRHSAQQERIPIDSHGYVRCDHLLAWQRLRRMKPAVGMGELVEAVGESDKMRFGLKYEAKESDVEGRGGDEEDGGRGRDMKGDVNASGTHEGARGDGDAEVNGCPAVTEEQSQTETQRAISRFTSGEDTEPSHFYIRANQGHSMKGVEAENLLTPITLEDDASIPETVVHGTFYGAWESILRDGGLRRMGRNHIHFSTGPPLEEVLKSFGGRDSARSGGVAGSGKGWLSKMMDESRVVSGMRRDAQILIYIDIRKALWHEEGMRWWRSENGVVLTEGKGAEGKVGEECWTKVVEVKEGLGVLWEHTEEGQGSVVKDLPPHLKAKAMPMGKNRIGGNAAGEILKNARAKPKFRIGSTEASLNS